MFFFNPSFRAARPASAAVAALACTGLLSACQPQPPTATRATHGPTVTTAAPSGHGAGRDAPDSRGPASGSASGSADLQRWAVNALLFTILDDDQPPRWTDPEVWAGCAAGTEVSVNGRPLVVGEHIPPGEFVLTWNAVDCHPLGLDGPSMQGRVALRLTPSGPEGWEAVVLTDRLEWIGTHGRVRLPDAFVAHAPRLLALAPGRP